MKKWVNGLLIGAVVVSGTSITNGDAEAATKYIKYSSKSANSVKKIKIVKSPY